MADISLAGAVAADRPRPRGRGHRRAGRRPLARELEQLGAHGRVGALRVGVHPAPAHALLDDEVGRPWSCSSSTSSAIAATPSDVRIGSATTAARPWAVTATSPPARIVSATRGWARRSSSDLAPQRQREQQAAGAGADGGGDRDRVRRVADRGEDRDVPVLPLGQLVHVHHRSPPGSEPKRSRTRARTADISLDRCARATTRPRRTGRRRPRRRRRAGRRVRAGRARARPARGPGARPPAAPPPRDPAPRGRARHARAARRRRRGRRRPALRRGWTSSRTSRWSPRRRRSTRPSRARPTASAAAAVRVETVLPYTFGAVIADRDWGAGFTVDLSIGGALVQGIEAGLPGDRLRGRLTLPSLGEPVRAQLRVIRVTRRRASRRPASTRSTSATAIGCRATSPSASASCCACGAPPDAAAPDPEVCSWR